MVWSEGNMSLKNPVTPPGIDPGTVRLVAQRLNDYATPGPMKIHTHTHTHTHIYIEREKERVMQVQFHSFLTFIRVEAAH